MSEKSATLLVLIAVALYSFFPVFNALAVDTVSPMVYVAKAYLFAAVIDLVIYALRKPVDGDLSFRALSRSANIRWVALSALLATIAYAMLVKSFEFTSNTAATITYELWPIFVLFLFPLIYRQRFQVTRGFDLGAVALAMVGLYFTFAGSSGGDHGFWFGFTFESQTQGLLMALASAVLMALAVISKSKGVITLGLGPANLRTFAAIELWNRIIGAAMAFVMALVATDFQWAEWVQADSSIGFGVVEGIGGLVYWLALSQTRRTTIQLLLYFAPVLSFYWLYLLGIAQMSNLILFGTMMIFSANILAHYNSDRTAAFSLSVMAAIASTVLCYYWSAPESSRAFLLAGVPTTLFAILIAFMMQRISQKFGDMKNQALGILMSNRESLTRDERETMDNLVMDAFSSQNWEQQVNENAANRRLIAKLKPDDRRAFESFYLAQINPMLVGETMVLILVGIASILAVHLGRPVSLFGDFFPVALTAAVVYLIATVLEQKHFVARASLQSIRNRLHHKSSADEPAIADYLLVSLFMLATILGIYAVILLEKYQFIQF